MIDRSSEELNDFLEIAISEDRTHLGKYGDSEFLIFNTAKDSGENHAVDVKGGLFTNKERVSNKMKQSITEHVEDLKEISAANKIMERLKQESIDSDAFQSATTTSTVTYATGGGGSYGVVGGGGNYGGGAGGNTASSGHPINLSGGSYSAGQTTISAYDTSIVQAKWPAPTSTMHVEKLIIGKK